MNVFAWVAAVLLVGPKRCHSFVLTGLNVAIESRSPVHFKTTHSIGTSTGTRSRLASNKGENDLENENRNIESDDSLPPLDTGILFTDLAALALACQLMGLLDVLNDPSFVQNGGWFQPVTSAPTLPMLFQRFSTNSVLCIASAASVSAFQPESLVSGKAVLTTAVQSAVAFSLLRLLLGVAPAFMSTSYDEVIVTNSIVELLRECYVVTLVVTAGRYILYSVFYRT
jgi:hypothetical protein